MGGHAVMQTPHGLILSGFPVTHSGMEQAYRNNALAEDVVDELLAAFLRDSPLFPPVDVVLQLLIAIDIPANACSELRMQIKVGSRLAFEGDEITVEGHIIADENAVPDGELERKRAVIGSPHADSSSTFLCDLIIGVDHPKELRRLYRELFFDDTNPSCLELAFQSRYKVVVGDWRPGICTWRSFEDLQPLSVDVRCPAVSYY